MNKTGVWVGAGCAGCVGIPALLLIGGAGGYFLGNMQRQAEQSLRESLLLPEPADAETFVATPRPIATIAAIATPEPEIELDLATPTPPAPTPTPVAVRPAATPIRTPPPVKRPVATPTRVIAAATPKPTPTAVAVASTLGQRRTIRTLAGSRDVTIGNKVALQGSDKRTLIGVLEKVEGGNVTIRSSDGTLKRIAESALLDASEL